MSRYILSPLAQRDLAGIRDYYLKQGSPQAARQMLVDLVKAFRSLARNPGIGHKREDLAGAFLGGSQLPDPLPPLSASPLRLLRLFTGLGTSPPYFDAWSSEYQAMNGSVI